MLNLLSSARRQKQMAFQQCVRVSAAQALFWQLTSCGLAGLRANPGHVALTGGLSLGGTGQPLGYQQWPRNSRSRGEYSVPAAGRDPSSATRILENR